MKSILTLVSFLLLSTVAQSQASVWWFDAGVKAGYGIAGLYNKNVSDDVRYNNDIGSGYTYGAKFSVNFDNHGMTVDAMFSHGVHKFIYDRDVEAMPDQNFEMNWKTFDIYALYRNNRNITYFEIGPKFSFLQNVNAQDKDSGEFSDVTSQYADNEISAVLGFGWYAMGNDGSFSGILGLRFEYGLTDFVGSSGKANGAPLAAVNTTNYASTNRLFASIIFEMNWGIGYFGRANCGGRSKFIKF